MTPAPKGDVPAAQFYRGPVTPAPNGDVPAPSAITTADATAMRERTLLNAIGGYFISGVWQTTGQSVAKLTYKFVGHVR